MFASLSRFRRETAVLAVLALLASVLVVVPVSAADPEADHPAMYSACVGDAAESVGFTDVPVGHTNAGDIDCIAYYGITKGTSVDTYSPLMLVTREQMALFLTRLAGLVGIEVASDASHPFTDIGDLSEESQTAIGQLADLGITKGNNPSGTTYGPADPVQRDHMALFISRLMKKMTKGIGGATPDDVADSLSEDKSPFTDLGPTTKSAYDAITQLWELGVASGINDTHYGPAQSITRAAMAGFMAGVLDHSNARPAGLSIQAKTTSGFGEISDPGIVVSYRDSTFVPMEGVAVQTFPLTQDQSFDEDGKCPSGVACAWSPNSEPTDTDGNIEPAIGAIPEGESRTVYAWMGDPDADDNEFDADTANAVSVTIASSVDADLIAVTTSDANKNASGSLGATDATGGLVVNSDDQSSVTLTAQLQSDEDDPVDLTNDNQSDVARSGVEITVGVTRSVDGSTIFADDSYVKVTTDDSGSVTFTVEGPGGDDETDNDTRDDEITFTIDDGDPNTTEDIEATARIRWQDESRVPTNATVDSGPAYQVVDKGSIGFRVTVRLYDQYGDPIGTDATANITIGTQSAVRRPISSRGVATYSATATQEAGTEVTVAVTITGVSNTIANDNVMPVEHAPDDVTPSDAQTVAAVYTDDNRFRVGGTLYTYDSGDTFLVDGKRLDSIDDFEKELDGLATGDTMQILVYDDDGVSIFRIIKST